MGSTFTHGRAEMYAIASESAIMEALTGSRTVHSTAPMR
jgi:hypothetical protein